ncbi:MAG: sulfite exporter TauE/SafE family protein [Gammaproteobacteria bacterium]
MILDVILLLAAGAVAGLIAGLFGVGGGLVIVPVLVLLFEAQGMDPAFLMRIALGTSLATIVVTGASSAWSHHKKGAVDWSLFKRIAPAIIIGTLIGALLADFLSGTVLGIIFASFLFIISIKFATGAKPAAQKPLPGTLVLNLGGGFIGLISALVGIGGGSMSVPYFSWYSVPIKRAVATSSALGVPIAVFGAIGYIIGGLDETGLPDATLGYIHLPAFGAIVLTSSFMAPVGAKLAHALPDKALRLAFAAFLFAMACRMTWRLIS